MHVFPMGMSIFTPVSRRDAQDDARGVVYLCNANWLQVCQCFHRTM